MSAASHLRVPLSSFLFPLSSPLLSSPLLSSFLSSFLSSPLLFPLLSSFLSSLLSSPLSSPLSSTLSSPLSSFLLQDSRTFAISKILGTSVKRVDWLLCNSCRRLNDIPYEVIKLSKGKYVAGRALFLGQSVVVAIPPHFGWRVQSLTIRRDFRPSLLNLTFNRFHRSCIAISQLLKSAEESIVFCSFEHEEGLRFMDRR